MMNKTQKKLPAECVINDTQAIRFLKATKLEFNFLEKVRESEREMVMNLIYKTKQMNWISTERKKERKKERKGLGEFYRIDDQKDQEIADAKSTTS